MTTNERTAEAVREELAAADDEWIETKRRVLILEAAADASDRLLLEMSIFPDRAWDALLVLQEMADGDTRAKQSAESLAKMRTLVEEVPSEFSAERGMLRGGMDRSLLSALKNREYALRQKMARLELELEAVAIEAPVWRRLWQSILKFLDAWPAWWELFTEET